MAVLMVAFMSGTANSDEQTSEQQMVQQAKMIDFCVGLTGPQKQPDVAYCEPYIKGFIAGASIIDSIFLNHLIDKHEVSSFQSRAFRTPVGDSRATKRVARYDRPEAPFCLSEEQTAA